MTSRLRRTGPEFIPQIRMTSTRYLIHMHNSPSINNNSSTSRNPLQMIIALQRMGILSDVPRLWMFQACLGDEAGKQDRKRLGAGGQRVSMCPLRLHSSMLNATILHLPHCHKQLVSRDHPRPPFPFLIAGMEAKMQLRLQRLCEGGLWP